MWRAIKVLGAGVAGYLAGAALGALLVQVLSSNTHDKALETAMTAAFVTGPAGAIAGMVAMWMWARRLPR